MPSGDTVTPTTNHTTHSPANILSSSSVGNYILRQAQGDALLLMVDHQCKRIRKQVDSIQSQGAWI